MAINPTERYPGQTLPDADYPYGKARNVSAPGSGDGTPWEQALVSDLFGFEQALLVEAGIVPSGTPDKVGASQYLEAINSIRLAGLAGAAVANVERVHQVTGAFNQFYDICFGNGADSNGLNMGLFLAVGWAGVDSRRYAMSYDGRVWVNVSSGSNRFFGCAYGGAGAFGDKSFLLVGADSVNRSKIFIAPDTAPIGLLTLTDVTASPQPQAPSNSAVWNGAVWCVVGNYHAATTAQFLTTENEGDDWDNRTVANSYAGHFKRVGADLATGRLIAVGTGGVIQISDDDGETLDEVFNDAGVGDLVSLVQVGGIWLAAGDSSVLRSIDNGSTWEQVSAARLSAPVSGGDFTTSRIEVLATVGGAVVAILKATDGERRLAAVSYDRGATWPHAFRLPATTASIQHRAAASDGECLVFCGGDAAFGATGAFIAASLRVPG